MGIFFTLDNTNDELCKTNEKANKQYLRKSPINQKPKFLGFFWKSFWILEYITNWLRKKMGEGNFLKLRNGKKSTVCIQKVNMTNQFYILNDN